MYKRQSLTKDEERIDVLEKMVLRLYEDMVAGHISEANFLSLIHISQLHFQDYFQTVSLHGIVCSTIITSSPNRTRAGW